MLADLLSRATCYIVADTWTTCYIVAVKPSLAAYIQGKYGWSKPPASDCLWWGPYGAEHYILGENQINMKQTFLQSTVQLCMFDDDAFQWAKPVYSIVAFW